MDFKTKTGNKWRAGPGRSRRGCWLKTVVRVLCLGQALSGPAVADEVAPQAARDFRSLDREIQVLKKEVLELSRDLRLLEEDVLYPDDQQLVVFVSPPADAVIRLNEVTITLGGQQLVRHVYSMQELTALQEGGVHRLYQGRLAAGSHYLDITLAGVKADGEAIVAETLAKITKRTAPKFLELQLVPGSEGQPPGITVNTW